MRLTHFAIGVRRIPGKGPRPGMEESRYYACSTFRDEFFEFVREYAPATAGSARSLFSILDYEGALIAETPAPVSALPEDRSAADVSLVPVLAEGVSLTECTADYPRVVRCLRRKGDLRRIPKKPATIATRQHSDKRLDVVHLSALSAQILKLCNGDRTVLEIARDLVPEKKSIAAIPAEKVRVFGLEVLRQQGLIRLYRAC